MSKETPHYQVMMGSYTVQDFVDQIDKAYKDGKETGEGILIAPFQRTYQWHTEKYPLYLLDSLNQNIFVMPVILVEHKKQTWIIDGQQRLATLYCYVKGYQPIENKPIKWEELITAIQKKDESIVENKRWTKLNGDSYSEKEIKEIEATPIGYSFLFNVNHEDDNKLLVDIFDRINNQGIKLEFPDMVRAYGWLYPNIQEIINNIENSQIKIKIGYLFEFVTRIYVFHQNTYIIDWNFFNPKLEEFLKDITTNSQVYNLYIPIINWAIENWELLTTFIENDEIHSMMFSPMTLMFRKFKVIPCMIGQYYFQNNKFPTDLSLEKMKQLLTNKSTESNNVNNDLSYEEIYSIYEQAMNNE